LQWPHQYRLSFQEGLPFLKKLFGKSNFALKFGMKQLE
jgi:hypothetical protein